MPHHEPGPAIGAASPGLAYEPGPTIGAAPPSLAGALMDDEVADDNEVPEATSALLKSFAMVGLWWLMVVEGG